MPGPLRRWSWTPPPAYTHTCTHTHAGKLREVRAAHLHYSRASATPQHEQPKRNSRGKEVRGYHCAHTSCANFCQCWRQHPNKGGSTCSAHFLSCSWTCCPPSFTSADLTACPQRAEKHREKVSRFVMCLSSQAQRLDMEVPLWELLPSSENHLEQSMSIMDCLTLFILQERWHIEVVWCQKWAPPKLCTSSVSRHLSTCSTGELTLRTYQEIAEGF